FHAFDGERNLAIRIADDVLTDAVHVLRDDGVVDDLGLPLDILREAFAQRDFLLERIPVEAAADVAIADFLGVLLLGDLFLWFFSFVGLLVCLGGGGVGFVAIV